MGGRNKKKKTESRGLYKSVIFLHINKPCILITSEKFTIYIYLWVVIDKS